MKTFSPPNTTPKMRNEITLFSQNQNMITHIRNNSVIPMDLNCHTHSQEGVYSNTPLKQIQSFH